MHLSDESRSHHEMLGREYLKWFTVWRNYWSRDEHSVFDRLESTGLLTWFPLGYGAQYPAPVIPSDHARHLVSFAGNFGNNPSRAKMLETVHEIVSVESVTSSNGFSFPVLNASQYASLLQDSCFCLQLPGASAECFRFYEALQFGCIPIIIDDFGTGDDYAMRNWDEYRHLLKFQARRESKWYDLFDRRLTAYPVPFIWIERPSSLEFINQIRDAECHQLKRESYRWWQTVKAEYRRMALSEVERCHETHAR
jgi:Exostosin family